MYQDPSPGFCSDGDPYSLIWYGLGCGMPRALSVVFAAATLATGSPGRLCQLMMSGTVPVERMKSRYWPHQAPFVVGTHAQLGPTSRCPGNSARRRWWVRRHSSKYWACGRFQKMLRFGSFQMSHCTVMPAARTSAISLVRNAS
jgi:hypothetical protein